MKIPGNVREIGESSFACVNSLLELSFEEGVLVIREEAFDHCGNLRSIAFPVSLEMIESQAFRGCHSLRRIVFPPGSRLQCMQAGVFFDAPLEGVVLPATVSEIDSYTFSAEVWPTVKFDGPAPFFVDDAFLRTDVTLLRCIREITDVVIPAGIEILGIGAFRSFRELKSFEFESGTQLREIGEQAVMGCGSLTTFSVPPSVEILGRRCLEDCTKLAEITFAECSRLRRIGERAFAATNLASITIPASTEEINGSAFVESPFCDIRVAPGSRNFMVQGNSLMNADGTEIVRYFGRESEVIVLMTVRVLRESCFESCKHIERVVFTSGSKLVRIGRFAFCECEAMTSIEIPAPVEVIEREAFSNCNGLEYCLMDENGSLVEIEDRAFASCCSLRSVGFPKCVGRIGQDCFSACSSLYQLRFGSGESLKKMVGGATLDDVLDNAGFNEISSLFRIEIEHRRGDLEFEGWVSIGERGSNLTLVQDI
jgi:hypothetical protein